jgi:uncharacterized protein (TIRG00374 family)
MPKPVSRLLKPASSVGNSSLWKWFLRLALGALIVGVLLRWQGASVALALKSASAQTLLLAVFGYLAMQILSAAKWRFLLNTALRSHAASSAPQLSFGECYRFYLIGMFCNLWLPTAVGGDAVRAAMAAKRCRNLTLAAASIFVERLTGLAALLAVGVLGLLFYFGFTPQDGDRGEGKSRAVAIAIIAVLLLLAVAAAIWTLRRLAHKASRHENLSPLARKLLNAHGAFDIYFAPATRPALFAALGLSLAFHVALIGLNIFLSAVVGLKLPVSVFVWLVPSLSIAAMLPLGIGGLGVREAGAVAFLSGALPASQMPDAGTAIAWSLLWQAVLWLSGLPGAFAYFVVRDDNAISKSPD